MKEAFRQYSSLTATLLKNGIYSYKRANKNNPENKIGSKISSILATLVSIAALCMLSISTAIKLTVSAYNSGMVGELFYVFCALSQMVVLFFGSITVISNLYLSRDNAMLASLPFRSGVVFAAKFTVAYVGELALSAITLIPMLTASGITLISRGYALQWSYFLVEAFAVFLVPALPLLVSSLIAMPLMYLVSALKKRSLGNGIAMTVFYVIVMALYFGLVGFLNTSGDESLTQKAAQVFAYVRKATIFNYPIVNALLGNHVVPYLFAYIGGVIAVTAIAVTASALFYGKALSATTESSETSAKAHKTQINVKKHNGTVAFYIKEIKTFIHTPVLFMSVVVTILLPAFIIIFYGKFGNESWGTSFSQNGIDMFTIGFITFFGCTMVVSTNQIPSVGFSREGKNLLILKSLPITVDVLVKAKLMFATTATGISALVSGIAFPFATGIRNPLAIAGFIVSMLECGFCMNCISLRYDLKNPNIYWNNFNEMTRNNRRLLKPMFLTAGINIVGMAVSITLGVINLKVGEYGVVGIYYGFLIAVWTIATCIAYHKLNANKERLFAQIGG